MSVLLNNSGKRWREALQPLAHIMHTYTLTSNTLCTKTVYEKKQCFLLYFD